MAEIEEWRPVVGQQGWYEISSHGRVRRVKAGPGTIAGKILKQQPNGKGYLRVMPSVHGKNITYYVHQLVAAAFLGSRPEGYDINHKDGYKANNTAENLEYIPRIANIHHAIDIGLWRDRVGEKHPLAKLNAEKVRIIRSEHRVVGTMSLSKRFGVSPATIEDVILGRTWRHVA